MTPYSLSSLAQRPKGTRAVLTGIEERAGSVVAYRKALTAILQGMAKETRDSVIAELRRDRGLTTDAPGDSWFRRLRTVQRQLSSEAARMVENILRLDAKRHTERFREDARRTLGIDLAAVVREEDLVEAIETALSRNVALITSLGEDAVNRVEQIVYTAGTNGTSLKEVRAQLQNAFSVTNSRAELIAQDQISKFNSDLNRLRQQQAGITKYIWKTSADERVRSLHQSLRGKEYRWGQPTGAEQGLPPGQPVRCRCRADPIVEF
ncbi:phage minor head protein [Tropicimonas sp. IMCC34011]|uniref:phage head morphogenesis protein n=1 Tax=Tropicimonas sp. IMCC34011 TaxID=2248759 RepID=UPI000E23AC24|nr:phage minor head protein [Tropicimonas sp. IMCC34011]